MSEVRRLAQVFRERHGALHVLLNNAGAIFMNRELTAEGMEKTFALDHLAYFLLTELLLDLLKSSAPARIVNVSSDAHRTGRLRLDDVMFERGGYSGWAAYGQAKLANVLFSRELAKRLEGTGVVVNAVHPGVVASGFGRNSKGIFNAMVSALAPLFLTPEKGARTSVFLASDPSAADVTGGYWVRQKLKRPSAQARDDEAARALWRLSEQLVAGPRSSGSGEAERTA
jgi:NAD(P)-dependent dehydrogenase (short-subunit alcohol dehydrogenase family)